MLNLRGRTNCFWLLLGIEIHTDINIAESYFLVGLGHWEVKMIRGAAAKKDAAIIVWDVGDSSSQEISKDQKFLDASKQCINKLVGNKLLVQPKDLLAVLKFGTEDTKHNHDQDEFANIYLEFELQVASFRMMEAVENTNATNIRGDWLGALSIALNTLRTSSYTLSKKSIVLISPLSEDAKADEVRSIIIGCTKLDAQLIIIGLDIKLENITSEEKPKFITLTEPDMDKKVQREKAHFEKGNKRKFVDPEEIIQGHKFGTTIVPFANEDKEALKYKSGEMCLRVICFIRKRKISPAMFFNTGCQMFAPLEEDPVSRVAFSALVRAMHEQQLGALVRKVARKDGRLIFGLLLPQIRVGEGARLMLIELPYADDARLYRFKRQDVAVSQEQLDAMDEFMDNMDLTTALPGGEEAFAPRETPDPTLVHFNEMLIYRALHPNDPLPSPSAEALTILEPPTSMKMAQEKLGPKLAAVFNVAAERKRMGRPGTTRPRSTKSDKDGTQADGADNLPLTQPLVPADAAAPADQRVVGVGSVTPAEDLQELLRQGRPLQDVCRQCLGVVLQLATLATNNADISKPLAAVRVMRKACRISDAPLYNKLVREIRATLDDRERTLLWDAIRAEELGLITRDENPLGGVSVDEAMEFMNPGDDATNSMAMEIDDIM
ncbi:hypothetical protein B566_EDAN007405 [Ephemera danica]|nr:hypothetical protein B566_EDAN007405 [Ephemera danica]